MRRNLKKEEIDAIAVMAFRAYEQGQPGDARDIFRGLIALDSRGHFGYAGLGVIALREERFVEAIGYLTQAIERNPSDATVRANLGESFLRQGRFDEASREFERAMRLDPKCSDPGANRARAILNGMDVVMKELALA